MLAIGDEIVDADALAELTRIRADRLRGLQTVAVVAHPTLDTVVTVLGGIAAGVPVVPIGVDTGIREREHILRDCGADLLVDGEDWTPQPGQSSVPAGALLVLYTSGTTGPPKGVPLTASAIDHCLDGLAEAWSWTPDDILVHGLPLHHVHGLVLGVLGPLHVGSALHHTGRPTADAYARADGSLYFGVPTVWSRVAAAPDAARRLRGARLLVSGSAALPGPVFDALAELTGQAPVERYGMTETLITSAARADARRMRGSVGTALRGVHLRLVDDEGAPVETGALGSVEVSGPTVFGGYLGRPDATASSFTPDGWFRTGDVARWEDGTLRIVGRASTDLIKSGGYRIGAGEIEDALLTHPAVHEAAVVGEPDDDLGQRIVAYVVSDPVDEQALIAFVAEELSAHKRPRAVRFVDALPRNAMGKVDKTRLGP